jgi:glutamate--cysteine ligase
VAPSPPVTSFDDVVAVAAGSFPTSPAVRSVGIETEWFVVDVTAAHRAVPPARTLAALPSGGWAAGGRSGVLPGGSRLTFEPGGQLELSGPPLPLADAVRAAAADLAVVRAALAAEGLALVGMGADPLRPPSRQVDASRYAAMEEYFRAGGHLGGPVMMCSTASVQVNLDAGVDAEDTVRRWRLSHVLGPVLVAMFAASPVLAGRVTGWRSTRQAVWTNLDRTRTRPVGPGRSGGVDLAVWWARYLLAARLMLLPDGTGGFRAVRDGTTFADWLAGRGPVARPPTVDDLSYHATTVFPPVRPRGWLELRYLDAQPAGRTGGSSAALWPVAVAVTAALVDDDVAAEAALATCLDVRHRWTAAARLGVRDDSLRRAANRCLELATDALARLGVDAGLLAAVDDFRDRYTSRGRCPADDLVDRAARQGPASLLTEEVRLCVQAS